MSRLGRALSSGYRFRERGQLRLAAFLYGILIAMRYRLHINRAEYLAAVFPFVDGVARLHEQHANPYDGSWWHVLYPYLLLSTPLILCLQYFYSYVELTTSSIELQAGLWHRSVPYPQIERIICGVPSKVLDSSTVTTEVYGSGMKKMSLKLEQPGEFVSELKQYAPQAVLE